MQIIFRRKKNTKISFEFCFQIRVARNELGWRLKSLKTLFASNIHWDFLVWLCFWFCPFKWGKTDTESDEWQQKSSLFEWPSKSTCHTIFSTSVESNGTFTMTFNEWFFLATVADIPNCHSFIYDFRFNLQLCSSQSMITTNRPTDNTIINDSMRGIQWM